MDAVKTLELDASFDEPGAIAFSVSAGFLCSVCTISNNLLLQFASSIKSHKLLCQDSVIFACFIGRQNDNL